MKRRLILVISILGLFSCVEDKPKTLKFKPFKKKDTWHYIKDTDKNCELEKEDSIRLVNS